MTEWTDGHEREAKLLYAIIVAGKKADFADRALNALLTAMRAEQDAKPDMLPFDLLRVALRNSAMLNCLRRAKTGNYTKIFNAFREIIANPPDLHKCTPEDLEKIHGVGPKTSRFYIIWARPEERFAALDVHVLRWLKAQGVKGVPKSTPTGAKYARLEKIFLQMADERGMTPRALDKQIWAAGAGRTQETAVPELEGGKDVSGCDV